jgi:glycerophosphoryl diester phosphodiesterase
MRRLIDWGIDGIVTDHIDALKEVMAEKGLA